MNIYPKRILHVTEAPLGGVVSCMEEMLRAQVEMDLEAVEVLTPEINLKALGHIDSPRLSLIPFDYRRGSVAAMLRMARLTIRQARATRPDILHVHSTFAGAVVRLCRPFLPTATRIVYCPHAWAFTRDGGAFKTRLVAAFERMLSHLCDRIVCVSGYEKLDAVAVGIPERKLEVIENGVTPPRTLDAAAAVRSGPADGRKVLVFVGRFDRQKGFDVFLEVLRRLPDEARGIVIGGAIVNAPEQHDYPDNLELMGWQPRDRVLGFYRQADLLLMPSRWEGFPLVALEAMQARLAIFATRVGGLQDIVLDRQTGRLFDPDDVTGIVEAIRTTSPDELARYGENGYRRYRELYTSDRMNRKVWALYGDVLGRRRRGALRQLTQ